jgi:hypothetical protein
LACEDRRLDDDHRSRIRHWRSGCQGGRENPASVEAVMKEAC